MIFDGNFWLLTIVCSLIGAGLAAALAFLGRQNNQLDNLNKQGKSSINRTVIASLISFPVVLLLTRLLMYYVQPVFIGSFAGYFDVALVVLLPSVILGCVFSARLMRSAIIGGSLLLILLLVPTVQYLYVTMGSANAQNFVNLPKIRTARPDEKLPPTDPDHMVLVTQSIAAFKGQTALTSTGGNLGSRYKIASESYTLQAIRGHRYYAAPLIFINFSDQINWGSPESPGYVIVDAENAETPAELKLGFHIRLFPDGDFGLNLERYLYQQGFTDGILNDATFEVDDDWQPTFTIAYLKRPFGNIAGRVMDKVIVVNVANEPKVTVHDASDPAIAWVDRVMSGDLVDEYVDDWGWYSGEYAKDNFWPVWFGWQKQGTMKKADRELAYTTNEQNVWVIPMTSTNASDHSVNGVLLYETKENAAVYFPGLNGFNQGSSVTETMSHARDNIRNYPVESLQLYSIYGELTWVAIYAAPQSIGKSFGGIGILHAHAQNAADVIFANDKQTALSRYASQLAGKSNGDSSVSQTVNQSKEITGKIKRIGALPIATSVPTYMFVIYGDEHTFILTRDTYSRVPLLREGDEVTFTFMDTKNTEEAVGTFHCPSLEKN
ncbi:hypothetical protein BH10CYA1_BH10CYA1_32480 [soil metagenome]